jgi:hypothetical protein
MRECCFVYALRVMACMYLMHTHTCIHECINADDAEFQGAYTYIITFSARYILMHTDKWGDMIGCTDVKHMFTYTHIHIYTYIYTLDGQ